MFYPERITRIKAGDRVLEVGPGSAPHPRSDVLLELEVDSDAERERQQGGAGRLATDKPVVYYRGGRFPFRDGEFDYVICSQVIEHVDDVPLFAAELARVACAGYVEFPSAVYEYLYNFDVHVNFVAFRRGELCYMKKAETPLDYFAGVQRFLRTTLQQGYSGLVDSLVRDMIEGFEWTGSLPVRRVTRFDDIFEGDRPVARYEPRKGIVTRALQRGVRALASRMARRAGGAGQP